jgi:hypothetical protein
MRYVASALSDNFTLRFEVHLRSALLPCQRFRDPGVMLAPVLTVDCHNPANRTVVPGRAGYLLCQSLALHEASGSSLLLVISRLRSFAGMAAKVSSNHARSRLRLISISIRFISSLRDFAFSQKTHQPGTHLLTFILCFNRKRVRRHKSSHLRLIRSWKITTAGLSSCRSSSANGECWRCQRIKVQGQREAPPAQSWS